MYVDRQIRNLIEQVQKLGTKNAVTFGKLYENTQNIFEALSGTLVAAKKRGVVNYEGQLLMKGMHDEVSIQLLRLEIEDSPLPDREEFLKNALAPKKAGGFDKVDTSQPQKCAYVGGYACVPRA